MTWILGILGLALISAPYVLGYSGIQYALWTGIAIGAAAVLAAFWAGATKDADRPAYWLAGIAGVLAVVAPWVLGFSGDSNATAATVVLGALVALISGYQLFMRQPSTPHARVG